MEPCRRIGLFTFLSFFSQCPSLFTGVPQITINEGHGGAANSISDHQNYMSFETNNIIQSLVPLLLFAWVCSAQEMHCKSHVNRLFQGWHRLRYLSLVARSDSGKNMESYKDIVRVRKQLQLLAPKNCIVSKAGVCPVMTLRVLLNGHVTF